MRRTDVVVNCNDKRELDAYVEYLYNLKGIQIFHHQERTNQRSITLNNYYWGVVLKYISDYSGTEILELHEFFKNMFIPLVIFTNDYDMMSTQNCDQEAMWDYCQMVRTYIHIKARNMQGGQEKQVFYIPDPFSVIRVEPIQRKKARENNPPGEKEAA